MKEMILKLKEAIAEIFPEIVTMEITPDTLLEQIPDWDSMTAINLLVFLNEHYDLDLKQDSLTDDTSFGEILEQIEERVS